MKDPLVRDGKIMAILRPLDADLAIRETERIYNLPVLEQHEAFNKILESQPYQFIGLACNKEPYYLDPETRTVLGRLKEGDSFVAFEDLDKFKKLRAT